MMVSLYPLQGEHGDDAEVLVTLSKSFGPNLVRQRKRRPCAAFFA